MNQKTYTAAQVRDALRQLLRKLECTWEPPCQGCVGYKTALADAIAKFGGRPR